MSTKAGVIGYKSSGVLRRQFAPAERPDFFTAKCYSAAQRGRVALVRTPDPFAVAQYLDKREDAEFARACRVAILKAEGILVAFPDAASTTVSGPRVDIPAEKSASSNQRVNRSNEEKAGTE